MPHSTVNLQGRIGELYQYALDVLSENPESAFTLASEGGELAASENNEYAFTHFLLLKIRSSIKARNYSFVLENSQELITLLQKLCLNEYICEAYNHYGSSLVNLSRPEKALEVFKESIRLNSEQANFEKGRSYIGAGFVYIEQGKYSEAITYSDKGDKILESIGYEGDLLVQNLILRGNIQYYIGNYLEATRFNLKAIEFDEKYGGSVNTTSIYSNIGIYANVSGDYEKALEWYEKALNKIPEFPLSLEKAKILQNKGNSYIRINKLEEALEAFNQSLKISREVGNSNLEASVLHNIARVYEAKSDLLMTITFYQEALILREKAGLPFKKCITLISLGTIFIKTKQYHDAVKLLSEGLEIAENLQSKRIIIEAHSNLAILNKEQKKWEEAYSHLERVRTLEKEIAAEDAAQKTKLLINKYEHDQAIKQAEIFQLENEKLEQEAIFNKVQLESLTTDMIQKNQVLSLVRQYALEANREHGLKKRKILAKIVSTAEEGAGSFWEQLEERSRYIEGNFPEKIRKICPVVALYRKVCK